MKPNPGFFQPGLLASVAEEAEEETPPLATCNEDQPVRVDPKWKQCFNSGYPFHLDITTGGRNHASDSLGADLCVWHLH